MQQGVLTTGGDISMYAATLEQCLKTEYNLTGRTIHNICEQSEVFIPGGAIDHLATAVVVVALVATAFMLVRASLAAYKLSK